MYVMLSIEAWQPIMFNQWSHTQEKLFSLPCGHHLPIATQQWVERNEPHPI